MEVANPIVELIHDGAVVLHVGDGGLSQIEHGPDVQLKPPSLTSLISFKAPSSSTASLMTT